MTIQFRPIRRLQRGAVLVYVSVAMVVFAGFVSLAVDSGHVRVVKNQLQFAADAAARYGAAGLATSVTQAQNNALAAAAENKADGTSVVLNANSDLEFGTWDSSTQTFAVLTGAARSAANAIRVTARRTTANGNPVPLSFGPVVGKSTCDASAQSIGVVKSTPISGFVGLGSVTFQNNAFFGSYDSSSSTSPSQASAGSMAKVGSNGSISGGNNNSIQGDTILGPSASTSGVTASGANQRQSTAIAAPTLPAWAPQANPGGIPQAYTVSNNTTLPGGSYWFTSLDAASNLTFSGPATVYINGNVDVDGSIGPSSGVPSDLTIYQYGAHTFGDGSANGMSITANIIAPGSDFSAKNNLTFNGSGVFNSISAKNNANFFFDTQLTGSGGAGGTVVTIGQ